jgi:hypothetical protein
VTEVENGQFEVFNNGQESFGEFFWHVTGQRCSIEVEPDKSTVEVKGDGPYKWI